MTLTDAMRILLVERDRSAPGWEQAAARLYEELRARCRAVTPRRLALDPDDLAGDLFYTLLRRAARAESVERNAEVYLQRSVRNFLVDQIRRIEREKRHDATEYTDVEDSDAEAAFERLVHARVHPEAAARFQSLGQADPTETDAPVGLLAFERADDAYRVYLETQRPDRRTRDVEMGALHRKLLRGGTSFVDWYDEVAGGNPTERNRCQRRVSRYREGLASFIDVQIAWQIRGEVTALPVDEWLLALEMINALRGGDLA